MRIIARSVIVLKPLKCARLTNLQWYISTLVRRGFELAFNWYFQKLIFLDLLSLGIDWNDFERVKHFPKKNQEISTFRFFHPFVWLLLLLFLCWTIILYHVGKLWFRASLFSSSSCLFCRLKCVDYRVRLTLFRLALLPQQSDYEKKREKKESRTNVANESTRVLFFSSYHKYCFYITAISILSDWFLDLTDPLRAWLERVFLRSIGQRSATK